jgi:hypothetical protein
MRKLLVALLLAGATLAGCSAFAQFAPNNFPRPAESAEGKAAPRRADGKPDLSGLWVKQMGFGYEPVDGDPALLMLPWAKARYEAGRQGVRPPEERPRGDLERATDDLDPNSYPYCLPKGFPRIYDGPHPFELIHGTNQISMLFETDNQSRRIYLDGREHPEGLPATFMGHSVGKWDGETLVVETTGLNDLTWIDGLGRPHSDELHVTERIRRMDLGKMEMLLTFDDPKTYAKPWTGKKTFFLQPGWEMMGNIICEDNSGERWREAMGKISTP